MCHNPSCSDRTTPLKPASPHVKAAGGINNKEYQELTGASKPTATRDLKDLVDREVFVMTGRGTSYTLKGS